MCNITAALYMYVCHSIHDVFTWSYPLPSFYVYIKFSLFIYHAYLYICRAIIMTDFIVHIACWTLSLLVGSYAGEHVSVEIEQLETCLSIQESISMARQLVHLSLPVATR